MELQHIYRALDYLAVNNGAIQTHIYNRTRTLFNYELDAVFYDVTTFYFDSEVQPTRGAAPIGLWQRWQSGQDTDVVFTIDR